MRLFSYGLMLLALGAVVFASVTPAVAANISTVSKSEREGSDKPVIFEDFNFSLESQLIDFDPTAAVDLREVVVGFVDFQAIIGTSTSNDATHLIKDIGATNSGTAIGDGTVNSFLSGWFVAQVFGSTISKPEGGTDRTVYFAPVPSGTMLTLTEFNSDGTVKTTKTVTWSPEAGAGTLFDLYEDSTSDLDTTNSITAYNSIVGTTGGGTDASASYSASVGFLGAPSTSATYANGGEYFVNTWDGVALPVGRGEGIYGSMNILGTANSPFNNIRPNDTGNTVYMIGGFTGAGDQWFATGDVDAKVLLAPLPGAAWGGLLLLGALGLGRNIRRRRHNS